MKEQTNIRLLSLLLCCAMVLGCFPAVFAANEDGLCQHHPVHTEECGYTEDTPCTFTCQECETEVLDEFIDDTQTIENTDIPITDEVTEFELIQGEIDYRLSTTVAPLAAQYEYAWFPCPTMNISQIAYESFSHGKQNGIDNAYNGNVYAPFSGKIVYLDSYWGYVVFQSQNKVYFADGSLDYMTVCFMHDDNISNLYVGMTVSQGSVLCQTGKAGGGTGIHTHISANRGLLTTENGHPGSWGDGNVYPYNAFYINPDLTTSITNRGKVAAGNSVYNGAPTDYRDLWKELNTKFSCRNRYPCDITFEITTACDAWNMPGSETTYPDSKIITTSKLSVGTQFRATEIIENAASVSGHYWYKTTVDGKEAYIYVPYTTHKTINWSVSVSGASKPTAINLGSSFAVKGTVQTGGSKITGIQGFVYPGNSTSGTPTISSVKATPNSTSYDLANEIDNTLIFNNISTAGYYTYVVKADLSSYYMRDNTTPTLYTKTNVILSDTTSYFTVGSPEPLITITFDANGGTCSTSSIKIESSGTISDLPYPTRSGYIFEGWYTSPSSETKVTTSTHFANNHTLYARWSTNYVNLGNYFFARIIHSASGYGISNVNGNIELGTLDKTALYYFYRNSDGTYTMLSQVDGKAIDVYNNNTDDSTNIQVYNNNGTTAQRWFIQNYNGYYVFISPTTGKAMDVNGGYTAKGTNVQLWTRNYSSAQLFSLKICDLTVSRPKDVSVQENKWVVFSANATSSDGPLYYQWYEKKPEETAWHQISNLSTNSELSVYATKELDGEQYNCLVYDQCGLNYWSGYATLRVSDLKITSQPQPVTIRVGSNATFTVAASSSKAISYQWMYQEPGWDYWVWFEDNSATTNKLNLTGTKNLDGVLISCLVSDETGVWLFSDSVLLQVCDLVITAQPKDVTAPLNSDASFSVGATSSKAISYQWQYRTSSAGTWQNVSATGNTTSKLTISATTARNGYQYRCIISDDCGMILISNSAILTVETLSTITQGKCGDNLTYVLTSDGVLSITGSGAMENYPSETGTPWYSYASQISSVIIESGASGIGDYAFYGIADLQSIEIPSTVTSIGNYAIRNAAIVYGNPGAMMKLRLPKGTVTVEDAAFQDCVTLKSVLIPASVTSIESLAFDGCTGLTAITFSGSAPAISANAFAGVTATVFYPENDPTWSSGTMQNYGGTLTWVPYEVK